MEALAKRLARGGTVLADGAWGTMLIERGLLPGECPEALCLSRPQILTQIAEKYLDAGAELLTTNTFGASPLKLRGYGLAHEAQRINRRAVELLRQAAGERAWVAGSVGPTGALLAPYGDTTEGEAYAAFELQVAALAKAGAHAICVETMTDLREALLAVRAARRVAPEIAILASMTFDSTPRGFYTIMGVSLEQAVAGLSAAGADAVGSNCGNGSAAMVEIGRELVRKSGRPVLVRPNAGLPERREGRVVYPEGPEEMARNARRLIELGVAMIGGCCGTTPEHIRAMREVCGSVGLAHLPGRSRPDRVASEAKGP